MKIGLYSPYIPKHAGGGERYLLSIAEHFSKDHTVSLIVSPSQVESAYKKLLSYKEAFGLDLSRIAIVGSPLGMQKSPIDTFLFTRQFDVFFAMTDGSFFATGCPHSFLIMQVPWTRPLKLSERLKLRTWKKILVYSSFVQHVLEKSWKTTRIDVVPAYVDTEIFAFSQKKEHTIVSVGRFFAHSQSNSKRQDILVQAFKRLVDTYSLSNWKLKLIGNVDPNPDSSAFLKKLQSDSVGYNIEILCDLTFTHLVEEMKSASIYWHATGYGVDELQNPENTEHFGITTLEAMATGAIPLVIPKGGQTEIVPHTQLNWNSIDELLEKTYAVIHLPEKERTHLRKQMYTEALQYGKPKFHTKLDALL